MGGPVATRGAGQNVRGGAEVRNMSGEEAEHMMFVLCSAVSIALLGGAEQTSVFPRVQVVPLPEYRIAFEVDGVEVACYHYGPIIGCPFVFPLVGPAGRPLTRIGHPHDPDGHGHHRSIWIGHRDVNGANLWEADADISHERVEKIEDGPDAASLVVGIAWHGAGRTVLNERRTMTIHALPKGECYLDIVLEISPARGPVTFGKTPFGFLGVRVAKTMSVNDGGGRIVNSEGGVNEAGVHWQRARWVDYAGRVSQTERNGIAFFDHPSNPRSPTHFHVRDDGWMGAAFTYAGPYDLDSGETLTLRYRLYAHGGDATPESIDLHWRQFAQE